MQPSTGPLSRMGRAIAFERRVFPSPEGRADSRISASRVGIRRPDPTPVGFADSALPSGEGKWRPALS